MTPKPVAAGGAGPALPMELEAGAAAKTGPTLPPKMAEAKKAGARRAGPAKAAAPSSASRSEKLGKTVDKALGKSKAPGAPAKSAPAAKGGSGTTATGGYGSATQATGEWAFLQDKGISIEDKLFRFLMLVQKKNDAELVKKMEEYKARFTGNGSTGGTSGSKGTSFFDVLKGAVPFVGAVASLIGEPGVKRLVGQLSGPVLAALATAAGMPYLAPAALQYGGDLAGLAFVDVGGKAASAGGSSGTGGASAAGESPDEKVAMFELQRLAEKQQAMFTAISNTLKCMHDTQMSAIHNIR